MQKIVQFIKLTKPKQLFAIILTMYSAYFLSTDNPRVDVVLTLLLVGIGTVGGVTALNMYIEIDIDSIMNRTKSRPLPLGSLTRKEAIIGLSILYIVGLIASTTLNKYVTFSVIMGLYFNIIAYTELTKRFLPISVLLGGIAGSMPIVGGWAAGSGTITINTLLLALLLFNWQIVHLTLIGYRYREDYIKASIPVIPVVIGSKGIRKVLYILFVLHIMLISLYLLLNSYGYLALFTSLILLVEHKKRIDRALRGKSDIDMRKLIALSNMLNMFPFVLLPIEKIIVS